MLKKVLIAFTALLLGVSSLVCSEPVTLRKDAPSSYVVKQGDTLWDISALYLNEPWLWPNLWQMNPQIDNPHLIYPGDVLSLIYDADGRPRLIVNDKIRRLSPDIRKTLKHSDAIATLPLHLIRPYLSYDQTLTAEQLASLPYVLGANSNVKLIAENHILYARGELQSGAPYGIYRQGNPFIDPDTGATLGYQTHLIATARAFRSGQDTVPVEPASLNVLSIKQEIRQGDKVIAIQDDQLLPAFFVMSQPVQDISGNIIDTMSKLRELSKWDVVVLNRGLTHELQAGNMLAIYRQSPTVIDSGKTPTYLEDSNKFQKVFQRNNQYEVTLPQEKVGELMVFKVAEQVSYAIVTKTQRPIRVGDIIKNI